jgi:HNH endonuclease
MRRKEIEFLVDVNGCHICTSHHRCHGYPYIRLNRRRYRANRYIYLTTKGEIPEGMVIRHTCDNRACINPDHLILGTRADNRRDMMERGRSWKGESHPMRKLCNDAVSEIYRSKEPLKVLSLKYRVSEGTISLIRNGKRWNHLTQKDPKDG